MRSTKLVESVKHLSYDRGQIRKIRNSYIKIQKIQEISFEVFKIITNEDNNYQQFIALLFTRIYSREIYKNYTRSILIMHDLRNTFLLTELLQYGTVHPIMLCNIQGCNISGKVRSRKNSGKVVMKNPKSSTNRQSSKFHIAYCKLLHVTVCQVQGLVLRIVAQQARRPTAYWPTNQRIEKR